MLRHAASYAITFALSMSCMPGVAEPERPNIILIMADDLGYECLSAYGSASYQTPELDRLAESGMRFTHCYSQPLCTPSRVQIMTGRYNFRNYTAFGVLPPTEITFGHLLQNAGYATAIAGKWQLYGFDSRDYQSAGKGTLPENAGFDDYCLWQVTKNKREGERYAEPLIQRKDSPPDTVEDGYGPDVFCDFILNFIDEHKEGPFFVYYPMALPHDPFVPTPGSDGWSGDRYARSTENFAGMVAYTDKIVGRIVQKLDELNLRENTLVIFTGDNGAHPSIESRMSDGRVISGAKGQPTDAGTRVPFIANRPGAIPAGVINDSLVDFSDFLPTLCELSGAALPSDRVIDGRSLVPQLRGEPVEHREWIFSHYDPHWGDREFSRFARDRRWKLYSDGRLFDVQDDPLEENPLDDTQLSPEALRVRNSLRQVLETLR